MMVQAVKKRFMAWQMQLGNYQNESFVESLRELCYSTTQDKSSELNIGFRDFRDLIQVRRCWKMKESSIKIYKELHTIACQMKTRVFLV